jgi:hypothetical protein
MQQGAAKGYPYYRRNNSAQLFCGFAALVLLAALNTNGVLGEG